MYLSLTIASFTGVRRRFHAFILLQKMTSRARRREGASMNIILSLCLHRLQDAHHARSSWSCTNSSLSPYQLLNTTAHSFQMLDPKIGDDRILEIPGLPLTYTCSRMASEKVDKDLPGFSEEHRKTLLKSVQPERWSDESLSSSGKIPILGQHWTRAG